MIKIGTSSFTISICVLVSLYKRANSIPELFDFFAVSMIFFFLLLLFLTIRKVLIILELSVIQRGCDVSGRIGDPKAFTEEKSGQSNTFSNQMSKNSMLQNSGM